MANNTQSGGIGFLGILTIIFVVLKATNLITWSWWTVFSPIWIPWAIILFFFVIAGIVKLTIK
jgi:hypothetical protein